MTFTRQEAFEQKLESRLPVIAIIRGESAGVDPAATLQWLARSGIEMLEVTTNTPQWPDVVDQARQAGFAEVGVGTVLTGSHVTEAAAAGATFTVAPGLDVDVVAACERADIAHLPGVMTPSDIQQAIRVRMTLLKLFPAGSLGVDYLRSLQGPFDSVSFIPTGGVSVETATTWLDAGAVAVGIGGKLFSNLSEERARTQEGLRRLAGRKPRD